MVTIETPIGREVSNLRNGQHHALVDMTEKVATEATGHTPDNTADEAVKDTADILSKDTLEVGDGEKLFNQHKQHEKLEQVTTEKILFAKIITDCIRLSLKNIPEEKKKDVHEQHILSKNRSMQIDILLDWMEQAAKDAEIKTINNLVSDEAKNEYLKQANLDRLSLLSSVLGTLSQRKGSEVRKGLRNGALNTFFKYTFSSADDSLPKDTSHILRRRFNTFRDLYKLALMSDITPETLAAFFGDHKTTLIDVQDGFGEAKTDMPTSSTTDSVNNDSGSQASKTSYSQNSSPDRASTDRTASFENGGTSGDGGNKQ